MTDHELPTAITIGAGLRGNEYRWPIHSFPDALAKAEALGYACLGGQFQFRLDDATCEMYWLSVVRVNAAGSQLAKVFPDFFSKTVEE
jgi:hypothetical protein